MMAAELYQKTLAGHEASLGKGESMSLSRYCKIHHVNNRGLRYWMKKHSIDPPKNKSRKVTTQSGINNSSQPFTSPGHMIPLLIQSPIVEKAKKSTRRNSSLQGVNITTQTGLVVCIPEIGCLELSELILSCNKDDYISMDESYYTILTKEKNHHGKGVRKGYIRAALGNSKKLVQYFYENGSRSREVLTNYIGKKYKGAIQSDGLASLCEISHNADYAQNIVM